MTTPTTVQVRLQIRADTAANWTSVNPILLANELGLETDTKKFKVGDGTTTWNSLTYFPSIVSGGTVLGNLEIGTTGTLTFEGSTADGFETTLGVVDPTADRTILLPDQSGTVVIGGNASITDADIAANAEIAVSKLANGTANQVLVTDGTDVSWSDNLTLAGDLTVNGTTTTINTETLTVKDKNIELAVVDTPTDVTADGGGITLKGTTDKTINWVDATGAWTSSERFSVPLGSASAPSLTFTGDENTGIYSPGADQLALSTNGTGRLFIDSSGLVGVGASNPGELLHLKGTGATTSIKIEPNSSSTIFTRIKGLNGDLYLEADPGNAENSTGLIFTVDGSERARIDSSGRLGIGTSSPSALLDVRGNIYSTGAVNDFGSGQYPIIRVNSSTDNAIFGFALDGNQSGAYNGRDWRIEQGRSATGAFNITDITAGNLVRLAINSSGNVGIGTATVGAPLEVRKNGAGEVLISRFANHNTNEHYLNILVDDDSNTVVYDSTGNVGGAHIWRTGGAERARIDSSGRLLVGTSSSRNLVGASYSLQIEGDGTSPYSGLSILNKANSNVPAYLILGKSRGGAGGVDAVSNASGGDGIGDIWFSAADGTDLASASARITCFVDGAVSGDDVPGRLVFSTTADGASSPTERVRINSSGDILVDGSSVPSAGAGAYVALRGGDNTCIATRRIGTASRTHINFINGNGSVGTIATSGTATAYNTSSDYRLKENVTPVTDGITRLQQLKPSRFNFIADPDTVVDGFLAHEVQDIVPEAITGEKDAVDDEGNPQYQGIDQSKLVPLLTAALQEAIGRIETLEAEVATLKG